MPTKKVAKKVAKKAPAKSAKKTASKKVVAKKSVKKAVRSSAVGKNVCVCKKTCKASHAFWVNNGPVVRSLEELLDALKAMSDEQYAHHTQRGDGNDFVTWIRDCLQDEESAQSIVNARTRVGTVRILIKRCSC